MDANRGPPGPTVDETPSRSDGFLSRQFFSVPALSSEPSSGPAREKKAVMSRNEWRCEIEQPSPECLCPRGIASGVTVSVIHGPALIFSGTGSMMGDLLFALERLVVAGPVAAMFVKRSCPP